MKRKCDIKALDAAPAVKQPRRRHRHDEVDRISQLPNDILISIISRLTFLEATATSILSTRWRYLYTYITHLNFPPFKPLKDFDEKHMIDEVHDKRFPNYINMINRNLDSHKASGQVKEFRVHMHCLQGANIDRWLEFALSSAAIESIDIIMDYVIGARLGRYTLGLYNLIEPPLPGLKCLKELSLSAVGVHDGDIELLLSSFSLLESLSIEYPTRGLTKVVIVGHSLRLKHFGISEADYLQSIEIGNMMNLVSLRCFRLASEYVVRLYNVPKLTEYNIRGEYRTSIVQALRMIPSSIRDQLRVLKISTDPSYLLSVYIHEFPKLINVKHLAVEVSLTKFDNFYYFILLSLIEACCSLEILEIKFSWWEYDRRSLEKQEIIERSFFVRRLSPNLKKLKLMGYLGCRLDMPLALCLVKNVVALEEFIVEPYYLVKKTQRRALRAWQQLRPATPNSVKLVII